MTLQQSELTRSPIRWAGSKRKLLPHLKAAAPAHFNRYMEPFCGSLCLLVALKPKSALVGDINPELIHFYRMMRWRPNAIADLSHAIPKDPQTYYFLRDLLPENLSAQESAARFLYLNRFCFNGVYRTNRLGTFNVARGEHMGEIPPTDELVSFGRLLRKVELRHCDFEELIDEARRNDFVYLDPPYAGMGVRDRGEYGPGAFKLHDLERLRECVERASRRGAKILISYADHPEFKRMFSTWKLSTIEVTRNVSGFASRRGKVIELMARNYL
jgi:DNA adenine methylase